MRRLWSDTSAFFSSIWSLWHLCFPEQQHGAIRLWISVVIFGFLSHWCMYESFRTMLSTLAKCLNVKPKQTYRIRWSTESSASVSCLLQLLLEIIVMYLLFLCTRTNTILCSCTFVLWRSSYVRLLQFIVGCDSLEPMGFNRGCILLWIEFVL